MKQGGDFPERVVPLGDCPSSPSGVVPDQLVPRVSRAVRPTVRTGFLGEWTGFPALSRVDGGEMAGAPSHERGTWTAPTPTRPENNRTNRTAPEQTKHRLEKPQNRTRTAQPQRRSPSEKPPNRTKPRTELLLLSPHPRTRQSGDDTPPLPPPLFASDFEGDEF